MPRSIGFALAVGIASLKLAGCDVAAERDVGEIEWGLGDKADGLCDARGDLCWPTADLRAVRSLERLVLDAELGERPAVAALQEAVSYAEALAHKLTDDELVRVAAIADDAYAPGLDDARAHALLVKLRDDTLARARATYMAAFLVPTGRAAEADAEGKLDQLDANEDGLGAGGDGYSDGMRESLRMLRDAGLGGRAYATMMELTGALDVEYEVLDRDTLATRSGPSRRARIDETIRRHRLLAGGLGTGTGLVSMIPIAGIPLSIPLSAAGTMAVHSRMTLEISALHGWDVREGANLYVVSMFLLSDDVLGDVGEELAAAPSLPSIIQRVAMDVGIPVTTTTSVRLAGSVTSYTARFLLKRLRGAIAGEVAEQAARGAANQIIGWATLGLSALASGAANAWVTDRLGRHVEVVSRPWVIDLPVEGLAYLSEPEARSCYASALAAVLRADGEVAEVEARYFAAFLAKPYYDGAGRWYELSSAERRDLARALAPESRPDASCLREFRREAVIDKLTILSHLYAAAGLTGDFSPEALRVYGGAVTQLDGTGWFSGPRIDPYKLDFVERATEIVLAPGQASWPLAYREVIAELQVEDMLPYLADLPAEVLRDVDCARLGGCELP
jgi:hypothetical protein